MKQRIGEEVTEQLEYIPAKLSVIAHVRPKYACNRCDETVSIAPCLRYSYLKAWPPEVLLPMPSSVNTKTIYLISPGTNRSRLGIEMPRNTVCGWIMAAFEACMPMREALHETLIASNYLQADETTMQVMDEPNRKNTIPVICGSIQPPA